MSHTAIILPVHNGAAYLPDCLTALQQQINLPPDHQLTVIAIENGSHDDSAALIMQHAPQTQLLRFPTGLGFAAAINRGMLAAELLTPAPDLIVLLNQDTIVDPGWLAAFWDAAIAQPQAGIIGSVARFPDGTLQHTGAMLLRPRWYGQNSVIPHNQQQGNGLPFVSFLAVAIRPALIAAIGLLDQAYGSYYEDADYCLRAQAAGWQCTIAEQATLIHVEGATQQQHYHHAAQIERNRLRTLLKHAEPSEILGAWAAAEQAAVGHAAAAGTSQVLRQAYLRALIDLPSHAEQRGFDPATRHALIELFASLRDQAIARERISRQMGLAIPHPLPATIPSPPTPPAQTVVARPTIPTTAADPPLVSIIMLTWNGLEVTKRCLESLRTVAAGITYQVIVVDNGSTDGTLAWLQAQDDLVLIANPQNVGFTAGNNQGMAAAHPQSDLLLLNNDTLITQAGWLARLHTVAHTDPRYGVVGCVLRHGNGLLQHAGTVMPDTLWGYQIGGGEVYVGQYPGVREVEGITGACMYIRRDVYDRIGGLDPEFFSYYEDSDYCMRARQAGYAVVCVGDVQVTHLENTSTKINRSDWQAMFSAGRQIYARKWQHQHEQRYQSGLGVVWHSLFAAPTGYATSSREFVRELDRRGVDVRTACIFGTDYTEPKTNDPRIDQLLSRRKDLRLPQVVYSQGDAFVKNGGRYKIGYTMHETDRLPQDWVDQANQMDEVWTPTTWGAEVFRASGIERPIHVVPLGFDPNYFHPQIIGRRPNMRVVFLSVFDWIERKGPDVLLKAYCRAFRPNDDVLLIVKTFNHDRSLDLRRHVADLVGNRPTPPLTFLLNQPIAAAQLGVLYRSADCFVLPTRGEGWGMPTLEAMACGLPVITPNWGAQGDFVHDRVALPLRIKGMRPAVTRSPYYAGSQWAEPDEDHLVDLLRFVAEHPQQARAIGQAAAAEVQQRWTWTHATERIMARLAAIGH
ncbi:MAG: glycosyltransferase [Roseiflexaceae bacterium]